MFVERVGCKAPAAGNVNGGLGRLWVTTGGGLGDLMWSPQEQAIANCCGVDFVGKTHEIMECTSRDRVQIVELVLIMCLALGPGEAMYVWPTCM